MRAFTYTEAQVASGKKNEKLKASNTKSRMISKIHYGELALHLANTISHSESAIIHKYVFIPNSLKNEADGLSNKQTAKCEHCHWPHMIR